VEMARLWRTVLDSCLFVNINYTVTINVRCAVVIEGRIYTKKNNLLFALKWSVGCKYWCEIKICANVLRNYYITCNTSRINWQSPCAVMNLNQAWTGWMICVAVAAITLAGLREGWTSWERKNTVKCITETLSLTTSHCSLNGGENFWKWANF